MNGNHCSHDKMHWGCCWAPAGGKGFWIFGVLAFVAGVFALWQGGEFWGIHYQTWYWTALVSGVLSAGGRRGRCSSCASDSEKR